MREIHLGLDFSKGEGAVGTSASPMGTGHHQTLRFLLYFQKEMPPLRTHPSGRCFRGGGGAGIRPQDPGTSALDELQRHHLSLISS